MSRIDLIHRVAASVIGCVFMLGCSAASDEGHDEYGCASRHGRHRLHGVRASRRHVQGGRTLRGRGAGVRSGCGRQDARKGRRDR